MSWNGSGGGSLQTTAVRSAVGNGLSAVAYPEKARASEEARGLRSKPQGVLGGKYSRGCEMSINY